MREYTFLFSLHSTFRIHVFSIVGQGGRVCPYSSVVECQFYKLKVYTSILHAGIHILYSCVFAIVGQGGRVPIELPR